MIVRLDGMTHVKHLKVLDKCHSYLKIFFLLLIRKFRVTNSQRQGTNQVSLAQNVCICYSTSLLERRALLPRESEPKETKRLLENPTMSALDRVGSGSQGIQ